MKPLSLAIAELCLACGPFAGFVGYTIAEDTNATPWIAGIASVLLTVLMVPVVKWMMQRIDGDKRQSEELAKRREEREDARQVAFTAQVAALQNVTRELQLLNLNHEKILERLDELPSRIVKRCNET